MKKYLAILILLCLNLGCAKDSRIAQWWAKPTTQAQVSFVQHEAFVFAQQIAFNAVSQWAKTGKVDTKTMFVQAGANTIYDTASQIRTLQGTAQVADHVAIAGALESNGYTKKSAQEIAGQIVTNITELSRRTGDPDQANEITAAGFDKTAADITK